MWLGCSSSKMIWEFSRKRNGAESTAVHCEERQTLCLALSAAIEPAGYKKSSVPLLSRGETSTGGILWLVWGSVYWERYWSAGESPVRTPRTVTELRKRDLWGWMNRGCIAKKEKKKGRCYELLVHKLLQEENRVFPMAVIARTKDILLNLQQNRFNLDTRKKLARIRRIKPFAILGGREVCVAEPSADEVCICQGWVWGGMWQEGSATSGLPWLTRWL